MDRPLRVVVPGKVTAEPPFPKIGIVGLDAVGGSIGLAARQLWPSCLVIGVDRNAAIEQAVTRHAIDVGADDLGMLAGVDLVVLAVPVDQTLQLVADLPDAVDGEALVTDVAAMKRQVVAAAARLPARLAFVGGHPLASLAGAGIARAAPDLFKGRPWVLTPEPTIPPGALGRLDEFVRALGALPVTMGVAEHDALMESGLSDADLDARVFDAGAKWRAALPNP